MQENFREAKMKRRGMGGGGKWWCGRRDSDPGRWLSSEQHVLAIPWKASGRFAMS